MSIKIPSLKKKGGGGKRLGVRVSIGPMQQSYSFVNLKCEEGLKQVKLTEISSHCPPALKEEPHREARAWLPCVRKAKCSGKRLNFHLSLCLQWQSTGWFHISTYYKY